MRRQTTELNCNVGEESLRGPAARRAVRSLMGDVPITFVRDALLLTSELTANATMHAGGARHLEASFDREHLDLRVSVEDDVTGVPILNADPGPIGGLGLQLVERLADRWGWTRAAVGKSVWFELSHHPPPA